MQHKCIDQLDKFYFRDAQLEKCELQSDAMHWIVSGLVARYNNPSNETLVDRYMETTQIRFKNASIQRMLLEGAKLYSADDVLLEEIPDTIIPESEYAQMLKRFADGIIFWMKSKPAQKDGMLCFEMAIDLEDEESETVNTYWMEVEYEKAIFEWDHFLNKAMLE